MEVEYKYVITPGFFTKDSLCYLCNYERVPTLKLCGTYPLQKYRWESHYPLGNLCLKTLRIPLDGSIWKTSLGRFTFSNWNSGNPLVRGEHQNTASHVGFIPTRRWSSFISNQRTSNVIANYQMSPATGSVLTLGQTNRCHCVLYACLRHAFVSVVPASRFPPPAAASHSCISRFEHHIHIIPVFCVFAS